MCCKGQKKQRDTFGKTEDEMSSFVSRWGDEEEPDARETEQELLGILTEDIEPGWDEDYDESEDYIESYVRTEKKIGRNDPCPCGSGKKYKKCCLNGPAKPLPAPPMQVAPPAIPFKENPVQDEHRTANDWMMAGYLHMENDSYYKAFQCWKRCWNEMKLLLPSTLTNPYDAEKTGIFEGYDSLGDWLQDFESLLSERSIKDVAVAGFSVEYFHELLTRFPKMSDNMKSNIKADLARSTALLERREEAVSLLQSMIAENPKDAQPYVVLSEMHSDDAATYGFKLDLPRAIEFLDSALKHAEDCADYDVTVRLENLRQWKTDMETPLL